MKKRSGFAVVLAVLVISAALGACSKGGSNNGNASEASPASQINSAADHQVSQVSEDSTVQSQEKSEGADGSEVSRTSETSPDESVNEESSKDESSKEQSGNEQSNETSDGESSNESSEDSAIEQGYFFDDEQIVEDYHHATEFTDDEKFNELFAQNDIDKSYFDELKTAESTVDMRVITQKYADQWKSEQEEAYIKLYDQLQELPEEQDKLVESQNTWNSGLEDALQGFLDEASGSGSNGLLAADSAILNYYKGRAAVLYYQIYLLTGSFDMN